MKGEARNEPSSWSHVTLQVVVQSVLHLEQGRNNRSKPGKDEEIWVSLEEMHKIPAVTGKAGE